MKKRNADSWVAEILDDEAVTTFMDKEVLDAREFFLENGHVPTHMTVLSVDHYMAGPSGWNLSFVQPPLEKELVEQVGKDNLMRLVGRTVTETTRTVPVLVIFTGEVLYTVKMRNEISQEELDAGAYSPANDPNRKEALLVTILTLDGRTCGYVMPFDKRDDGRFQIVEDEILQTNIAPFDPDATFGRLVKTHVGTDSQMWASGGDDEKEVSRNGLLHPFMLLAFYDGVRSSDVYDRFVPSAN